jgi:hypothetical protein
MLGTSRRGAGHAQGGREGEADVPDPYVPPAPAAFPSFSSFPLSVFASVFGRYGRLFP